MIIYINIWVGYAKDLFGTLGIAGRAYIPTRVPDEYIGVSVAQSVFGTINPTEPTLAQGKTLTHELGHFFGLIGHTDGVITDDNNHAALPCDDISTNCENSDLANNFMRVTTSDNDIKMFSLSQQRLMREWLETGPLQNLYLNNLKQN